MAKRKKKAEQHELQTAHCVIGLLILVLAIYANSFGNQFTNWDDKKLVLENPQVTEFDFVATFVPVPGHTYQPLRVLSYAIDYGIWGDNPLGYHIGNTVLHALASIFLFLAMARLLPNRGMALLVALLFAVHPVNVESVSWISSRKYGLLATFGFLSLYCYLRSPQKGMAIGAAVAMALAMMSSPFGIVLPALFVLIDLCRCELRKRVKLLLPIAIAAAVVVPMILIGLFGGGGGPSVEHHVEGKPHWTFFTTLRVLFDYGVNLTLPLFLNNKYPNHMDQSLFAPGPLIGLFGCLALGWLVVKRWRCGDRMPAMCAGWFFIAWLPVSNLVPTSTTMADRYLYLPAVGVFMGLAFALNALIARKPEWRQAVFIAVGVILLAHCGFTVKRNTVWKNNLTLWADCLAKDEKNPIGQNNYGDALREFGDIETAAIHYQRSLDLYEPHSEAHQNMGVYLIRKERWEEAVKHLRRALEIRDHYAAAWSNLGVCLMNLGDTQEAASCFDRAEQLDPRMDDYPLNHALARLQLGEYEKASEAFERALALDHSPLRAREIGGTLVASSRFEDALPYLRTAHELAPQDPSIAAQFADCLAKARRLSEAVQVLEAGLRANPGNATLTRMLEKAKAVGP